MSENIKTSFVPSSKDGEREGMEHGKDRSPDIGPSGGDGIPKTGPLGTTLFDEPERSLLRRWLRAFRAQGNAKAENPDVSWRRQKRWANIGWEVFERKALLLAAARDLEENGVPNPLKLAATDIFVEKAQRYLTIRARLLYWTGILIALLLVATLGGASWYVFTRRPQDILQITWSNEPVSTAFVTVVILKATTAGGFVAAIAYFLVSLCRALLHESTVLYSRRHSLRFGRLFVYLMSEKMSREDLVAVFNWNAEFSTAFKDIQPDQMTKTAIIKAMEIPRDLVKAINEGRKEHESNSDNDKSSK
jgi:hypothetical protein